MKRTPVKSSQIASIGYDAATKRLEIEFTRGGATYHYDNVPQEAHDKLMAAESVGKHFGAHIRPNFKHTKLQDASAKTEPRHG